MNDKIKDILIWVLCCIYAILIISVSVFWWVNDDLTEMQVFKEVWWWFIPSGLLILLLIKKLDE